MFDNLIESKKKGFKSTGQTIVSVVFHVLLVFGAVTATRAPRRSSRRS